MCVWETADSFEVVYIEVSLDRSSVDALFFLKEVLKYCRGEQAILGDHGKWFDWPLDLLECEGKRETGRDRVPTKP